MKKLIITALCAVLVFAMVAAIPAFAADDTFTIAADTVAVGAGETEAQVKVYFKDITPLGLCAVKFYVTAEGCEITNCEIGPDMPGSYMPGETGSETISFLWVDISKGVYEDTLAATFKVKLPAGAKAGDEIPVKITLDDDPDNYLAMELDSATGENANLTPKAENGKITIGTSGTPTTSKSNDPAKDTAAPVDDPAPAGDTNEAGADAAQSGAEDAGSKGETTENIAGPGRLDIGTATGKAQSGTKAQTEKTTEAKSGSSMSTGAKIGIAAGVAVVVIAAICAVFVAKKNKEGKHD